MADSLIKIDRTSFDDSAKLHTLYQIISNHTDPDKILAYTDTLFQLAKTQSDRKWMAKCHFQKGNAYRLKGDLDKATAFYFESAKIANKIGYRKGVGGAYLALGDVYSINDNHNTSVAYYRKAIKIYREENDSIFLGSALLNLGDEYFNANQLDSAFSYFNESQVIFDQIDYEVGIAYCLGNLGLVHAMKNNNELAEKNINSAIEMLRKLGDQYPISVYLTYMADIYEEKGDWDRALAYAKKSLQIARESNFKEQIRDANLTLSELYSDRNDFEKAYQHQSQYISYRDSVNNEATIRKMADLRTEFEVSQKQAEIDLLTQTKRTHQVIAISLVVVVFLVGLLAYILFRNNRAKQVINNKLLLQKQTLQQQHDQLEALNKTKDRFFSIISHDLRGPVNAFNGISSLIKHYVSTNDMKQLVEVTEYIDKSASQLSTLLDNLLDWAINQQGSFPYHPVQIQFEEMMDEIFQIFQTTAHAKKINFHADIQDGLILWADRNSLTTILRNLVNNSLKFTNPEGSVSIRAFAEDDWGVIEVVDSGIGIPANKLASIFELIEKKNTQGTAGEKGLGLGLQLAYDFSEMNKGSIAVESEENVGTKFIVKIPLFNEQIHQLPANELQAETFSS